MTDHKFTDEQIIKALELCSKLDLSFEECDKCPYKGECGTKDGNMPADALALINRQKVEIESLKIANEKMYSANKEQEAEIEALKEEVNRLSFWNHIKRTAVIDEFAERLKADIVETGDEHGLGNSYPVLTHNYIDTLVKEMTENTK